MGSPPGVDVVRSAYARSLIRSKARQLVAKAGFTRSDQEDIEQELAARLIAEAHRFDPARGSASTFADRVIRTAVAMILRDRRRLKRGGGRRPATLDQSVGGDERDVLSLAACLTPLDLARRHGLVPRMPVPAKRLAAVVAGLPPELQALCRELTAGTPSAAARNLGRSRRWVRQAMERIREACERADLDEF